MAIDQRSGDVEFSAGSADDFDELPAELRGVSGLSMEAVGTPAEAGDQGSVVDLLTVACSGGALAVLLQIVKALVGSRGPGFILKARRGKDRIEITADNVDEALPLIAKLLDGS